MLELGQIVGEIDNLTAQTRERADRMRKQLTTALAQAHLSGDDWAEQDRRIREAQTRWLTAIPVKEEPTPIASATAAPPAPSLYTALATDGSQIPLDRHALAPCYVINIGEIAIHYGEPVRPRLTTSATLHYKEDDVLLEGDGEPSYVTEREIATRRMLAEAKRLKALISDNAGRQNTIALMDGTLILWAQEAEHDENRKRKVVAEFVELLTAAREAGIPVASYLSSPGSRDVVNALRITLCPETTVNCHKCPYDKRNLPCAPINRITDSALFERLLAPGERSELYFSQSKVLDFYPDDQKIAFFYVHAGSEIARIEAPKWVAEDLQLVDRVHALVLDQVNKGNGYPVCLTEAHERAVVRAPERDAFFRLVERAFVRHDIPVRITRKAVAKRTRIL